MVHWDTSDPDCFCPLDLPDPSWWTTSAWSLAQLKITHCWPHTHILQITMGLLCMVPHTDTIQIAMDALSWVALRQYLLRTVYTPVSIIKQLITSDTLKHWWMFHIQVPFNTLSTAWLMIALSCVTQIEIGSLSGESAYSQSFFRLSSQGHFPCHHHFWL